MHILFAIGCWRPYRRSNILSCIRAKNFCFLKFKSINKVKAKKQKAKNVVELPVVNSYSAGIDIGDTTHVVAVADGLATERMQTFGKIQRSKAVFPLTSILINPTPC